MKFEFLLIALAFAIFIAGSGLIKTNELFANTQSPQDYNPMMAQIFKDKHSFTNTQKVVNSDDKLNSMCMPCDVECKPECCLNRRNRPIYSCSTGCVCFNDKQYKYLLDRGGNNI